MMTRLAVCTLILAASCGGTGLGRTTKRPEILGSKCDMAKKQAAPLIVDWTSQERSRLEAAVRKGAAVPVRVDGCEIEPLWQCELPGRYGYQPSSVRREAERIADRGSLYARVPTTAVALEAKIDAGSQLQVAKTTVGRFEVPSLTLAENQLKGQCDHATHFVSAVDVGAFEFSVAQHLDAEAKVAVGNAGGGVTRSSAHELLAADGDLERCGQDAGAATEPREGCHAPIQIDLTPLVPSLTKDEFLAVGVKGTTQAFDTCHVGKQLGGKTGMQWLVYIVADPDGTLSIRYPGGSPAPEYEACIRGVWQALRVEPFGGPAIALEAEIYDLSMQPGQTRETVVGRIEENYLNNFSRADPGIPPLAIGTSIHYDYAKYGITPTDAWQVPGAW
jgi:hypothetical protein